LTKATPPPGNTFFNSSTGSRESVFNAKFAFFHFYFVAAPTLITATPPDNLAKRFAVFHGRNQKWYLPLVCEFESRVEQCFSRAGTIDNNGIFFTNANLTSTTRCSISVDLSSSPLLADHLATGQHSNVF
jgi:hypothetical protein